MEILIQHLVFCNIYQSIFLIFNQIEHAYIGHICALTNSNDIFHNETQKT